MTIKNDIEFKIEQSPKLSDLDYGDVFVFADEPNNFYMWMTSEDYVSLDDGVFFNPTEEDFYREVREVKCTLNIEGIK